MKMLVFCFINQSISRFLELYPLFVLECQCVFSDSNSYSYKTQSCNSSGCIGSCHFPNQTTAMFWRNRLLIEQARYKYNLCFLIDCFIASRLFKLLSTGFIFLSGFIFLPVCHLPPRISGSRCVCFHPSMPSFPSQPVFLSSPLRSIYLLLVFLAFAVTPCAAQTHHHSPYFPALTST